MIDAHQHFWTRDMCPPIDPVLERDFLPADLAAAIDGTDVRATILVQCVDTAEENARLLRYAAATPLVHGVVAWLPLDNPDRADAILATLRSATIVRGVRSLIGRTPIDWMLEAPTMRVLHAVANLGLAWDVVPVTHEQRDTVAKLAQALPELRIVVDHLARPPIETRTAQPWADDIRRLADQPNIAVKISIGVDVLTAWGSWSIDALTEPVHRAIETFGAQRAMLASNWPVVSIRTPYATAWHDLDTAVRTTGMSYDELAAVREGTAYTWYRIAPKSTTDSVI